jgi:hypothetical protein
MIAPPLEDHDDRAKWNNVWLSKSDKHKYGLCYACLKGLDDKADFRMSYRPTGTVIVCDACFGV